MAGKIVTVHGVLPLAMPAGTRRQQARNCGLEQRVSPDLKQRVSPCPSPPPKIFPEFLPSAGSRWILIPPRGMSCLPPYEGAGSNSLSELLTEGLPNPAEVSSPLGTCGKQPLV